MYERARKNNRFTLVEMLVVIAIVAILASLLLPSLQRARESGLTISCASQQKQIGCAIQTYSSDNQVFPPVVYSPVAASYCWTRLLMPNLGYGGYGTSAGATDMARVNEFRCPSDEVVRVDPAPKPCSYALNFEVQKGDTTGTKLPVSPSRVQKFSSTLLVGERWNTFNTVNGGLGGDGVRCGDFHASGSNYLHVDGHVRMYLLLETTSNSSYLWKFTK